MGAALMQQCIRCYVSRRVQGVFFRAATREKALELHLSGWARNLPDGRVEVLACGEAEAVGSMQEWLQVGPPHAQVAAVDCAEMTIQAPAGFTTG